MNNCKPTFAHPYMYMCNQSQSLLEFQGVQKFPKRSMDLRPKIPELKESRASGGNYFLGLASIRHRVWSQIANI